MDKKIRVFCIINKEFVSFDFYGTDWGFGTMGDDNISHVKIFNSTEDIVGVIYETKGCHIVGCSFVSDSTNRTGIISVRGLKLDPTVINSDGGVVL